MAILTMVEMALVYSAMDSCIARCVQERNRWFTAERTSPFVCDLDISTTRHGAGGVTYMNEVGIANPSVPIASGRRLMRPPTGRRRGPTIIQEAWKYLAITPNLAAVSRACE
jgi:hypothetical protein